ncbi:MGH1-like glycoside hydrolase domain-containing protein [Hymenobacter nivis]|uniref:Glucosidase n=1 Tax=Hymenobacter nivis TaxID=1850093 RepID=A0A2Z3GVI8_9BACT|nr:glucosidase [Hymenobacter nivis]AWM32710.1 glucosidase [Hymenobacter nivis]
MTAEHERLRDVGPWRTFGPYLAERQWGTVREDYSAAGEPWNFTTHDMARSYTYRWGEDGLGGISDDQQLLCFAPAFWNGQDPILKERLFGLSGPEGNHGEDVKELYYYLDNTPTHSYMRMLYKYPQHAFPYDWLVQQNAKRTRDDPEFELADTAVFREDKYFDIFIEYAKAGPQDVLITITAHNRGPQAAPLHVLPTLWFRNTWAWGDDDYYPDLRATDDGCIAVEHRDLPGLALHADGAPALLFCDNETNAPRLYRAAPRPGAKFFKDGLNECVVGGHAAAVNADRGGTKAAAHYVLTIEAGESQTLRLRLGPNDLATPFADFDALVAQRRQEADAFYGALQCDLAGADARAVQRQALAGMLWNKQFYDYDVRRWLAGDPTLPAPPASRLEGRNADWLHVRNHDIISMPDNWEYPWYAAWDLAFHAVPLALVDPEFAKSQLRLLCHDRYMHANGQLPAYEWQFGDVNPPVHAWATFRVFKMDQKQCGGPGDVAFLETVFHRLLLNFTWWVNRKDTAGRNIFEGGFLGLDNIGVFDRSAPMPPGVYIEQADGTAWMALYALNLMRMALELAQTNPVYEDLAGKYFEHFLAIAQAMTGFGPHDIDMWDEEDEFYYDVLKSPQGRTPLKVRSMVGLVPLFAVEVLDDELLCNAPQFLARMNWILANRPDLAGLVSRWQEPGKGDRHLLSLLRGHRLKALLRRMLDEAEFLSAHGVRALSKYHLDHPYVFRTDGKSFTVDYEPSESTTSLYGGNSNWRGPVWFPVNYMLIEGLQRFHHYYGDDFKVEFPTGSGQYSTLLAIAEQLTARLTGLFLRGENGQRPCFGADAQQQTDPHFKDYLLFHEYFHGDTGQGLGASHQTGWTGLVAKLLQPRGK